MSSSRGWCHWRTKSNIRLQRAPLRGPLNLGRYGGGDDGIVPWRTFELLGTQPRTSTAALGEVESTEQRLGMRLPLRHAANGIRTKHAVHPRDAQQRGPADPSRGVHLRRIDCWGDCSPSVGRIRASAPGRSSSTARMIPRCRLMSTPEVPRGNCSPNTSRPSSTPAYGTIMSSSGGRPSCKRRIVR